MLSAAKYLVSAKDVLSILQASIVQGLSIESLLSDISLPEDLLTDQNTQIGMDDCWNIIAAHQNILHDETHLLSSRPLMRGTTKHIFSSLTHCSTLVEGLRMVADTYNVVHGGNYNAVRHRSTGLSFVVDDSDFHYRDSGNDFAIEFALLRIHCVLTYLVGQPLAIKRIATKRIPDAQAHHHLDVFNCEVQFNHRSYELVYASEEAERLFRQVEKIELSAHLWNNYLSIVSQNNGHVSTNGVVSDVIAELRNGHLLQKDIARELCMSTATLRRKLKQERTTFRALSDRVHGELAANDLMDRVPVEDVAEKFGYADIRSFKRAFVRWHGQSPAAFIKQKGAKS